MTANDRRVSALALAGSPDPRTTSRRIDHAGVLRPAGDLLRTLGADAEALEKTPRRVADAYAELLTPQTFSSDRTFPTTAATTR